MSFSEPLVCSGIPGRSNTKGQVYLQEGTYSPRFFQILLRMDLVAAGTLPDGQRTLMPTTMALSAFIEETERLARKAGYRFKLISPP